MWHLFNDILIVACTLDIDNQLNTVLIPVRPVRSNSLLGFFMFMRHPILDVDEVDDGGCGFHIVDGVRVHWADSWGGQVCTK